MIALRSAYQVGPLSEKQPDGEGERPENKRLYAQKHQPIQPEEVPELLGEGLAREAEERVVGVIPEDPGVREHSPEDQTAPHVADHRGANHTEEGAVEGDPDEAARDGEDVDA